MTLFLHFQNRLPAQLISVFNIAIEVFNPSKLTSCLDEIIVRYSPVLTTEQLSQHVSVRVCMCVCVCVCFQCYMLVTQHKTTRVRLTETMQTLLVQLCSQMFTLSWQTTACTAGLLTQHRLPSQATACTAGLLTQHRLPSQATTHILDCHTTKAVVVSVTVRYPNILIIIVL